jgi:hypothetical protein
LIKHGKQRACMSQALLSGVSDADRYLVIPADSMTLRHFTISD